MAVKINPVEDSSPTIEYVQSDTPVTNPADGTNWFPRVKALAIAASHLATNAVTTAKILAKNVTLDKVQDIAAARILGRASGVGSGITTELTAAQVLTILFGSTFSVDANGNVAWTGALKPPAPATPAFSTTLSLDVAEDNYFTVGALTANTTVTFANRFAGAAGIIRMTQGGAGGFQPTWNTESAAVTFQNPLDFAGDPIAPEFADTTTGAVCEFHFRFVTATLCTIYAVMVEDA